MKALLPLMVAPILVPTLTGLFALVIATFPIILIGMVVAGLILKSRE